MRSLLLSLLLTFLSGGLYALAYPSFLGHGWFPLIFISIPFFIWRLEVAPTLRSSLLHILSYNLGLNVIGYYWIPETLREFGQLPYPLSVLLGLLFSFILQPHWWAYALWKKVRPDFPWFSERGILITSLVITLLERFFPQQFPSFAGSPWLHLAPHLGLAPIFGVVIFSFMTYWLSLEIFSQLLIRRFRLTVWISLIIFLAFNAFFPLRDRYTDKTFPVRVVQANVGNFLKVQSESGDTESFEEIRIRYENLSTIQNGFKPKLIVWPETAYPTTFYGKETALDETFKRIIKDTGAEMLIGGYDQDPEKSPGDVIESVFNSSILITDGAVKTAYHKNILIPFGETLPFGPFNSQIVSVVPAVSLFARGAGTPKLETKEGIRFVTPICYEILESNYMRSLLNEWGENHLIINHTNDSWYGNTAEPYQHLFLSKWRALEFKLAIVRSTNTGLTSVIYPDGSESNRLHIGEKSTLDVSVPIGTGEGTVYQRYGIYTFLLFFFIIFVIVWFKESPTSLKKN